MSADVQDSWKSARRLTVNYGVRFEPFIAPYDGHGRHNYFTTNLYTSGYKSTSYPLAPVGTVMSGDALAPATGKYMFNRVLQFVPRLAMAWDPEGDAKRDVRAAYGIVSDLPLAGTVHAIDSGAACNRTT